MEEEENVYDQSYAGDFGTSLRNIETNQRLIKDRLLLIGKNLIDTKENTDKELITLKQQMEIMQIEVQKIKEFLETISQEFSKFAKKEDLEILSKQARMFQHLK